MSGVMRFTNVEETTVFTFDSSPEQSISRKIGCNAKKFELRNMREIRGRKVWDVFSIRITEDIEKTPVRKFGTLEYQAPVWPGGPCKPWLKR